MKMTFFFLNFSVDFDNYMQQDAHEFLNFLINHINEIIVCKYLDLAHCITMFQKLPKYEVKA